MTEETASPMGVVETVPLIEISGHDGRIFKRNPAADAVIDFVAGCNGRL